MQRAVLTAALIVAAWSAGATASDPWRSKIAPEVAARAERGPTEMLVVLADRADLAPAANLPSKAAKGRFVYETLARTAALSQAGILEGLTIRDVPHRSFWVTNMIWVDGDAAVVEDLARRPEVARIVANPRVERPSPAIAVPQPKSAAAIEWNIALVGADQLWAEGIDGSGVVIGGQDTGYDWDHPGLITAYRGWDGATASHAYNWHDAGDLANFGNGQLCPGDEPCDDHNHGTHTMGTMVGDDGAGNRVGMAPGARWIGCRNMDQGWGTPASYAACYEWFVAPTDLAGENPDPAKAPHVINNSWACPPEEGCNDPDILKSIVETVRAAGIVPVTSAGNSGPSCSSVTDPAAIYDASYTVANTTSTDAIASGSSRGPVTTDGSGRSKPDIAAPGTFIRSTVPDTGYATYSGTSMAGPHVAGLVALLIDANPTLAGQVDMIEEIISTTAVPLTPSAAELCGDDTTSSRPNNVFGWGRIDAVAAADAALALPLFADGFESGTTGAWGP